MAMAGGLGGVKPSDDVVVEICQKIRKEVEDKCGAELSEFTPIEYKTQLVNGINYFIKVRVSDGKCLHVRSHKTFDGKITFSDFEDNKAIDEEIKHF